MKPKSGKAIKAVKPAAVEKALEADVADPGAVEKVKAEQAQKNSGKYGKQPAKPFKPSSAKSEKAEQEKKSWIEIELIDEADQPVAGQRYEITLPDGRVAKGTLDAQGLARIDGIDPGTCQVSFPDLDKDAWEKA